MPLRLGFLTAALALPCLAVATLNLANFYPISEDDGWIMSASYKLASEGILGSDMWRGFFGADRHYFIALPVHHVLQATAFVVAGTGIVQARAPALLAVSVLVVATLVLAYRWYGSRVAALSVLLLVLWPSNLIATDPRPPFLALAQSGRYDVTATAFVWLSVLLLDRLLDRPRTAWAIGVGCLIGVASLTQFIGLYGVPVALAAVILPPSGGRNGRSHGLWIAAGFLMTVAPYGLYVWSHAADFARQASIKGPRLGFDEPDFYLANLLAEPSRYAWILAAGLPWPGTSGAMRGPISPWLLVLGCGSTLLYLVTAPAEHSTRGGRILAFATLGPLVSLAVTEQSKAPVYLAVLLPATCILLALGLDRLVSWSRRHRSRAFRLLLAGLLAGSILTIVGEGVDGYRSHVREAGRATPYLEVGRIIKAHLPAATVVLGSERWWWALRERHAYVSLNNLWHQWRSGSELAPKPLRFGALADAAGVEFIVVNDNARGDLLMFPTELQRQFSDYLKDRGTLVADWRDFTYGRIEVYRVDRPAVSPKG